MQRIPPKFGYCGMTVILSFPSRFDLKNQGLLTSNGGMLFDEATKDYFNRHQMDIRTRFCGDPLLPDTKVVMLLGEQSARQYLGGKGMDETNTLGEIRGSPYIINGIVHIATWDAQQACDPKDFERTHNPLVAKWLETHQQQGAETVEAKEDDSGQGEKRRHGITSRTNYRFWFKQDFKKAFTIIENKGRIPANHLGEPQYIIYPRAEEVINVLSTIKEGEYLDFDMETFDDLVDGFPKMTCFAFSVGDSSKVYVVPIYKYDSSLAYEKLSLAYVFRSLSRATKNSILVAHNGAGFDYMVLGNRYRIPIRATFDTLLAAHRCWPEIEKSLGHLTSLLTYEPFHKDEASFAFGSQAQAYQLWQYCGKDIWTMKLIRKTILQYAAKRPGLMNSIQQAMSSIRPYLTTCLQGIAYDQDKVVKIMASNDRMMNQYLRMIRLLTGEIILPTSNKQCIHYFHEQLQYPVIGRSKKTNKPSLNEKNMLRLRLKYENPVIDFMLAYRQTAKESGSLKFIPWRQ